MDYTIINAVEVLNWVHGVYRTEEESERAFRRRAGRRVNRHGYVRYRHWRRFRWVVLS